MPSADVKDPVAPLPQRTPAERPYERIPPGRDRRGRLDGYPLRGLPPRSRRRLSRPPWTWVHPAVAVHYRNRCCGNT